MLISAVAHHARRHAGRHGRQYENGSEKRERRMPGTAERPNANPYGENRIQQPVACAHAQAAAARSVQARRVPGSGSRRRCHGVQAAKCQHAMPQVPEA